MARGRADLFPRLAHIRILRSLFWFAFGLVRADLDRLWPGRWCAFWPWFWDLGLENGSPRPRCLYIVFLDHC